MTLRTVLIRSTLVSLLVVATACGSAADEESTATSASPTTSGEDSEVTEPTTSGPAIIGSVTADTVPLPTDDSGVGQAAEELRDGVPTEKGTTYAIIDPTSGTGFSFVSSVDGAYPFLVVNVASLSLDPEGNESLLGMYSLDQLRTFLDPTIDLMSVPESEIETITEPSPPDYLAWVAALPGVTVGPVEEATVDGWPARSMTYEFGPSHNGQPCDATSLSGCLFALWNPAGSVTYYIPNDTGTMYEVMVDGHRALVDVSFRPGAQQTFETLHFLLENEG